MSVRKSRIVNVPSGLHLQSQFFSATRKFWYALGKLESAVLSDEIKQFEIQQPIYVAGLARSGTTILTEMLDNHPDVTSHRYSDFPNIWTPYWRNYLLQKTRHGELKPAQRAHKDRIQITNDSPEAIEEVLWMHFFPQCHAAGTVNTLGDDVSNPQFESFYHKHIKKLLLVRHSSRYLAKGNYNVSRFAYLLKMFPDARFLIPFRDPVGHIASLLRQHRYFIRAHEQDQRVGRQLALAGHFEFGPYRKAIHFGDKRATRSINAAWSHGNEVEGWALYWRETYRFLLDQVRENSSLRQACLFLSYEHLCTHSNQAIDRIIEHCALRKASFVDIRRYYIDYLSLPDYYQPKFSADETAIINRLCTPVVTELNNSLRLN